MALTAQQRAAGATYIMRRHYIGEKARATCVRSQIESAINVIDVVMDRVINNGSNGIGDVFGNRKLKVALRDAVVAQIPQATNELAGWALVVWVLLELNVGL